MFAKTCAYQSITFDEAEKVYVSSCYNTESQHGYCLVDCKICNACEQKVAPNESVLQEHATMFPESVPCRPADLQEQLFRDHCETCPFLTDMRTCMKKNSVVSVCEFLESRDQHCPLERW